MTNHSVHQLIEFLTVAEFSQVMLLIFILFVMGRNRKANIFFAAFLFILSSNFFAFYLFRSEFKIVSIIFALLSIPGISAAGVLMFFYASFVTGAVSLLRLRHLLHFVPFFISLFIFTVFIVNSAGVMPGSSSEKKVIFILISGGLVISILYISYTFIVLKRYALKIEDYFSDLEKRNLRWLTRLTSLSFAVLLFWCGGFWLSHLELIPRSPAGIVLNLFMLIIIIFITAYHLINQPEIFQKNIEMNIVPENMEELSVSEKYARQNIDSDLQRRYLASLEKHMEDEKPFLEEDINIKELSTRLGIPYHHLSIVINSMLNKNFYTFINEYRIREAKMILNEPENLDASILSIAFRSGFNSKSTFNSVFKKNTGQTPSEYRDLMRKKSRLAS